MAISRAQMLKELIPGLHALFGLEYKRYAEPHKELYDEETSERAFEEETKLSGFGVAPVKAEGDGVAYDQMQEAWTARYQHETIALAFSMTEEAAEDNLYESVAKRGTKALARAMAETKQIKAAAWFNNGFTASSGVGFGGDGVSVFNTAHPTVGGGTNSNRPSTGVDLNETSLEAAIIAMAAWTDERGLLIQARPVSLHIPPALEFVAERLLKSEYRTGTAENDISAVVSTRRVPRGYFINYYFTDINAWFLKNDITDGFKHFVRTKLYQKEDGDFDTGNMRFKARERYSFGVSDPLQFYGSPGSF